MKTTDRFFDAQSRRGFLRGTLSTTLSHLTNIAMVLQRPLRWDGARERFIDDPVADSLLVSPMRAPWNLNA